MITQKFLKDLDSPHRELFVRSRGFIEALLVRWQFFLSVGGPTQLYVRQIEDNSLE